MMKENLDDVLTKIIDQVIEIVTGNYSHGIIRISKEILNKFGYPNRRTFEEEKLVVIYRSVEMRTGIDTDDIIAKMKNKVFFVEGD